MKYTYLLLILLCCFSCQDDPWEEPAGPTQRSEGYATLTVQVPGINNPKTYAGITDIQENDIDEIDVLAFVEGEDGKQYFSYRIVVNKNDIKTDENAVNRKTFDLHLKRLDEGVRLMILGNSFSALNVIGNAGMLVEGTPYEDIIEALTFRGDFWQQAEISSFQTPFPMWGETTGKIYATAESDRVVINEVVKLLRSVARIDVGVDIYGDPALGFGKRFKVEDVIVYRAAKYGRLIPDAIVMEGNQVNAPTLVYASDNTIEKADPIHFLYEPGSEKMMERSIYLAESIACEEGRENEATCLVIGAVFNGGSKTYYRIDFIDSSNDYIPILRNHKYQVNITSIAKDGYTTAQEAADAKSSYIKYDLEVIDDNINDILVGNEYTLGVSSSLVLLDWYTGASTRIFVRTEYQRGWTASITEGGEWLTIEEARGNTQPNTTGELDIKAISQNTESFYRYATITFTAGELKKEVRIRQRMGSNCYIISTNEPINLPVAFANADKKIRVTENQPVSAKLVWMDGTNVIDNIQITGSGKNATIKVTAGTQEGNAVVAATNSSGDVLWSWHIWVTNQNPEAEIKSNNYYMFMDRNLGALQALPGNGSFGLLYQWGRKDPFPGADLGTGESRTVYDLSGTPSTIIDILPVTVADNIENAITNPHVFYTSAVAPYYSWTGLDTSDNLLWSDEDGNKTPYDPCPDGWRVPLSGAGTRSPWQGLTAGVSTDFITNMGWEWSQAGYYPATGCRMSDTGMLADVAFRGFVWSATPYSANAYLFRFGNSANSVNASATNYRANGYAIRCVKE